jgi:hypothetical protein
LDEASDEYDGEKYEVPRLIFGTWVFWSGHPEPYPRSGEYGEHD